MAGSSSTTQIAAAIDHSPLASTRSRATPHTPARFKWTCWGNGVACSGRGRWVQDALDVQALGCAPPVPSLGEPRAAGGTCPRQRQLLRTPWGRARGAVWITQQPSAVRCHVPCHARIPPLASSPHPASPAPTCLPTWRLRPACSLLKSCSSCSSSKLRSALMGAAC